MKKVIIWITVILLVIAAAVAGFFIFDHYYLVLDSGILPRSTQSLDLSGQTLEDLEKLAQLQELQELDLRNTGLTADQYEYLQAQIPQCHINWLVPFQDSFLPLDTEKISVTDLSAADISLLSYFAKLTTIDATSCNDYDTLLSLQQDHPEYKVLYQLSVSGLTIDQDATAIAGTNIDEISASLAYLPGLTFIDATGCTDTDALLALRNQYPDCEITYEVPLNNTLWSTETIQMDITSCTPDELSAVLPHLDMVASVSILQPLKDPSGMLALKEAYPNVDFTYSFTFLDRTVSNRETTIDISSIPLESVDFIYELMPHFLCLEKVDMCDCGISNEEMDVLNQAFPESKFVWKVKIGMITVRTDITVFMPFQYGWPVKDAYLDNMKYLTDLVCLDFGHQKITRTDYLAYMPNMQYLILGHTDISDLTPLSNLKELKYLELFLTDIRDLSPLLECEKLEDLNIGYTYPKDVTVLCEMKQLKNLWFCGYWHKTNNQLLIDSLPNTKIVFEGESSTGGGWRKLPNYYAQRDLLGMFYMIED